MKIRQNIQSTFSKKSNRIFNFKLSINSSNIYFEYYTNYTIDSIANNDIRIQKNSTVIYILRQPFDAHSMNTFKNFFFFFVTRLKKHQIRKKQF
jgi:hypothetical protein